MYFDNLTLLGIVSALAIGVLLVRLVARDASCAGRVATECDGVDDDGMFARS
jgi:hypothetical protein